MWTEYYSTVWITGASDGIGKSLALLFATRARELIVSGKDEEKLACLVKECEEEAKKSSSQVFSTAVIPKVFDCSDIHATVQVAYELAPRVDLVLHCAGISQRALSYKMNTISDDKILKVNFVCPVEISKILIIHWLRESTRKKIVYVSSVAAHIPAPNRAMYGSAKRALEYYCTTSRNELKKQKHTHISQSIVIPGFVHTNISIKALVGTSASGSANGDTTWGKMDKNQEKGISADRAAKKILRICKHTQKDIYVGVNFLLYTIMYLVKYFPKLANVILAKLNTTK